MEDLPREITVRAVLTPHPDENQVRFSGFAVDMTEGQVRDAMQPTRRALGHIAISSAETWREMSWINAVMDRTGVTNTSELIDGTSGWSAGYDVAEINRAYM